MAEIGSVEVRVRPDTKGFGEKVKAELAKISDFTIKVNLELDDAALRAELAALGAKDLKIPAQVDLDQDTIGKALAGKKIKVPAEVDIDQDALGRAVAGRTIHIKGEVDVDRNLLGRAFSSIGSIGKSVFTELGSIGSAAIGGVSESVGELGKGFSAVGDIAGTVLSVAKFAAVGFAVAEGGAAIAAAYGAASTAIAAVPAAIGLIGAPLAAVMLGMDGIKKAASALTPEFNKLKAAVSATFQKQLTPVFTQLKGAMTALAPSIQGVATSLAGLAQQTADWITKSGGLAQIQTVFTNVATAIKQIDLTPLLDGFVRLAGNQAALGALTGVVNELGVQIQAIADNPSLDTAFAGLGGVLDSLTTAFGELVNNGIKLFASAAPGIKSAVDAITGFFKGFDYNALGASVGNAFTGIANAIKQIPPATVQALQTAFQKLGDVLGGPTVSGAIQVIADQLPGLVTACSDAIDGLADIILKAKALGDLWSAETVPEIKDAWTRLWADVPPIAKTGMDGATAGVESGVSAVTGAFAKVRPAIDSSLSGAAAAAAVQATRIKTGFIGPISPLPAEAQQIAAQVTPGVKAGMAGAPAAAQASGVATAQGLKVGLQAAPGFVNEAFVAIGPLINEAMAGLATYVSFGTVTLGNALSAGLTTNLGPAMTLGLAALGTQVTTFFATNLSMAVGTGMLQMQNAVTLGLVGVQTAFTTGLGLVGTNVTTFFATTFSLAVGTGMLQMQNAVTLGLVGVQTAFTTGLGLVATGVTTFFSTTLSMAVGTGMLQVANAVTVGMVAVGAAFTAGFTTVNAAINAAMVNAAAAMTAGFVGVNAAVTQGMTDAAAAVTAGGTNVTTAITTVMTNLTKAITDGGTLAVAAVTDMMAKIIAAIPPDALNAVGGQLIQGMAAGMIAAIPAVEEAARQAVQKAVAAAQAEANVNSPSKLTRDEVGKPLTEGIAVGQLKNIPMVEDAARKVVRAGLEASQREMAAAQSRFDGSNFGAQIESRVNASISDFDTSPRAGRAGGTVPAPTVININGSDSRSTTELANTVKFRFRTGRRGVHANR